MGVMELPLLAADLTLARIRHGRVYSAMSEPADWVAAHDLVDDQVEVYVVGDAVVLLPSRDREAVGRFLAETLDGETYRRLAGDSGAGAA